MGYVVDRTQSPPVCLPAGVDRSRLTDVTPKGAPWRVYIDPRNGMRYNGATYFRKLKGTCDGNA